jgi:hypothetical protein
VNAIAVYVDRDTDCCMTCRYMQTHIQHDHADGTTQAYITPPQARWWGVAIATVAVQMLL